MLFISSLPKKRVAVSTSQDLLSVSSLRMQVEQIVEELGHVNFATCHYTKR